MSEKTANGGGSLSTEKKAAAADARTPEPHPDESKDSATQEAAPAVFEASDAMDVRNIALTVLAVIAAILVLRYAQAVLIPIVLAVLISYVLGPMVDNLANRGLSRWVGAALVIALSCGGLGYGVYKLAPQVMSIVDDMPNAARRLLERSKISRRREEESALEKMQRAATEIDKAAAAAAEPAPTQKGVTRVEVIDPPFRATDYLWAGGRSVVAFLGQFAMVLFLVFFLLVTGDLFKRKLVKIAGPTLTKKKITVQIMDDINKQISGFLRVQVITSLVVGGADRPLAVVLRPAPVRHLGDARRGVQLDPLPRSADRHRRPRHGRLHPVRRRAQDQLHLRRRAGHHQPRRLAADTRADEPRGTDEPGGDLRRPAVLELGLGRVGDDPRRPDDDDGQGDLRQGRGSAAAG